MNNLPTTQFQDSVYRIPVIDKWEVSRNDAVKICEKMQELISLDVWFIFNKHHETPQRNDLHFRALLGDYLLQRIIKYLEKREKSNDIKLA